MISEKNSLLINVSKSDYRNLSEKRKISLKNPYFNPPFKLMDMNLR